MFERGQGRRSSLIAAWWDASGAGLAGRVGPEAMINGPGSTRSGAGRSIKDNILQQAAWYHGSGSRPAVGSESQ